MDSPATADIGIIIRNAFVFDPKNWANNELETDSLIQDVLALFIILEEREIDYLLVGGVAMLQYVDGRNTEDIDLIMALSSLAKVPEVDVVDQSEYFARGRLGQLKIDFLLTRNPLFETVQQSYSTTIDFQERQISIATVEGLILLKLYALPSLYRQGKFTLVGLYENDVAALIHIFNPDLDPLYDELGGHLSPSDMTAVRDIVSEILERIRRFEQGLDNTSDA